MTAKDAALAALADHDTNAKQQRAQLEQQIEDRMVELIADALNAQPPATWREIGTALGKPYQNLWRKYAPRLEKTPSTVRVKPATAAKEKP